MNELNYQEELEFCKEYYEGEEILWMGKSVLTEKDHRDGTIAAILCIISIAIMLFFRTTSAYITGGLFIGFAFLFCGGTDVTVDARREKSFYMITNRKIIRKIGDKVDFIYSTHPHEMEVAVQKNGCGTIKFLDKPVTRGMNYYWGRETEMKNFFYLENVPNVRRVEQLIRSLEEK